MAALLPHVQAIKAHPLHLHQLSHEELWIPEQHDLQLAALRDDAHIDLECLVGRRNGSHSQG